VKFEAQVLGQKPALLFRPYRACHCFTAQTQGDALGFHIAPRWGWEGRVRPQRLPVGAGKAWFVTRRLPVGAGKAWFVTRPLPVGAGKAWFVTRPLAVGAGKAWFVHGLSPLGLGRQGSSTASPYWGWEGVVHRAASARWARGPPHRWHLFQAPPQGNDLSPNGAPCESPRASPWECFAK
jgi:hypothetical protein